MQNLSKKSCFYPLLLFSFQTLSPSLLSPFTPSLLLLFFSFSSPMLSVQEISTVYAFQPLISLSLKWWLCWGPDPAPRPKMRAPKTSTTGLALLHQRFKCMSHSGEKSKVREGVKLEEKRRKSRSKNKSMGRGESTERGEERRVRSGMRSLGCWEQTQYGVFIYIISGAPRMPLK